MHDVDKDDYDRNEDNDGNDDDINNDEHHDNDGDDDNDDDDGDDDQSNRFSLTKFKKQIVSCFCGFAFLICFSAELAVARETLFDFKLVALASEVVILSRNNSLGTS